MKNRLIFFMFLVFHFCFSQKDIIPKKVLLKTFKETIVQPKKGIIDTSSNPWFTENTNNCYFKNDTVVFKNARSF